jgi:hypothetical protein
MPTRCVSEAGVQDFVKTKLKMRIDGEAIIFVHREVDKLLRTAAERAKANRRRTIRPYDL